MKVFQMRLNEQNIWDRRIAEFLQQVPPQSRSRAVKEAILVYLGIWPAVSPYFAPIVDALQVHQKAGETNVAAGVVKRSEGSRIQ